MRLRRRVKSWISGFICGTAVLAAPSAVDAQGAVWRASRPLKVPVAAGVPTRYDTGRQPGRAVDSGKPSWEARADHLRRLRAGVRLVRAEIDYLERRLKSYDVFRFSDAMVQPIAQTRLALAAARAVGTELETEIRRVSRAH